VLLQPGESLLAQMRLEPDGAAWTARARRAAGRRISHVPAATNFRAAAAGAAIRGR